MRFTTLSALVGMTAASASAPSVEATSIENLLAPQSNGYSRDITSLFRNDGLSLQNKGFTAGHDGLAASNQLLFALMNQDNQLVAMSGSTPGFPREIENGAAVIDDFENGFDNWTPDEGRSFSAKRAFDGAAYNQRTSSTSAKISGFEGKHFAFSFEGRNENTGKAESKPFEVKWDQISFDIMGGVTNQTRLDLVVIENGSEKVVKTASGDGTLAFKRKSWNVKSLKGQTVKLVITDDSTASSYGFIGVDNIRGEASGSGVASMMFGLAQTQQESRVLSYFASNNVGATGALINSVTVEIDTLLKLETQIKLLLCDSQFDLGNYHQRKDFSLALAKKIDTFIDAQPEYKADPILRVYSKILAASVWPGSRGRYDPALGEMSIQQRYEAGFYDSQRMMQMSDLRFICTGAAILTRDIARDMGIECYYVNGYLRDPKTSVSKDPNHTWVAFVVSTPSGKIVLWSDPSSGRSSKQSILRFNGATRTYKILPIFTDEVAMFAATRSAECPPDLRQGDRQNVYQTSHISFSDWCKVNIDVLERLELQTRQLR